jgi:hypothetical protein
VDRRTVQRDLNVLAVAGINYSYDAEQRCYVLRGDYRFAVTALTDDEVLGQATATALTSAKGLDITSGAEWCGWSPAASAFHRTRSSSISTSAEDIGEPCPPYQSRNKT